MLIYLFEIFPLNGYLFYSLNNLWFVKLLDVALLKPLGYPWDFKSNQFIFFCHLLHLRSTTFLGKHFSHLNTCNFRRKKNDFSIHRMALPRPNSCLIKKLVSVNHGWCKHIMLTTTMNGKCLVEGANRLICRKCLSIQFLWSGSGRFHK